MHLNCLPRPLPAPVANASLPSRLNRSIGLPTGLPPDHAYPLPTRRRAAVEEAISGAGDNHNHDDLPHRANHKPAVDRAGGVAIILISDLRSHAGLVKGSVRWEPGRSHGSA